MEIKVFVKEVLPEESGTSSSTGKPWRKVSFICYDNTAAYPKDMMFTIFNPNENKPVPQVGTVVVVSFDIESRSFIGKDGNKRYSTDLTAWKITPESFNQPTQQPVQQQQPIQFAQPAPQVGQGMFQQPAPQGQPQGYAQPAQYPYGQMNH